MSTLPNWSTTAANNSDASPDGFPEGMAPSGVNNSAREVMASVAKWYADQQGTLTSAGSGSAYTLTTNMTYVALSELPLLAWEAHTASAASATLNVDSLGAKTLKKANNADLGAGNLATNQRVVSIYNADDDVFEVVSQIALGEAVDRLSASNPTSGTELDFDGVFTDEYESYEIRFSGVIPNTGPVTFNLRLDSAGGASYDSGASDYDYGRLEKAGTGAGAESSGDAAHSSIQLTSDVSSNGARGMNGRVVVYRPTDSSRYTRITWELMHEDGNGDFKFVTGGGARLNAQADDSVQFVFNGVATFNNGRFQIYGYR